MLVKYRKNTVKILPAPRKVNNAPDRGRYTSLFHNKPLSWYFVWGYKLCVVVWYIYTSKGQAQ